MKPEPVDLVGAIRDAVEKMRDLRTKTRKSGFPGWADFERRIGKQILMFEEAGGRLAKGLPLSGRGRSRSAARCGVARENGGKGGRPRRKALVAALNAQGDDRPSVRKLMKMPARLLRYAYGKARSDRAALRWLQSAQPEFGGEAPLFTDLRRLRTLARRLDFRQAARAMSPGHGAG